MHAAASAMLCADHAAAALLPQQKRPPHKNHACRLLTMQTTYLRPVMSRKSRMELKKSSPGRQTALWNQARRRVVRKVHHRPGVHKTALPMQPQRRRQWLCRAVALLIGPAGLLQTQAARWLRRKMGKTAALTAQRQARRQAHMRVTDLM